MSTHIPAAVLRELERRVEEAVADSWYHYDASKVARWAYRRGVRDTLAKVDRPGGDCICLADLFEADHLERCPLYNVDKPEGSR